MNQIIIEITWLTAVNKINNDESSKMHTLFNMIVKMILQAATHSAKTFRVTWIGSVIIRITATLLKGLSYVVDIGM